jgi:N-acetylmuramic acid 6-phosphate etherase
MTKRRHLTTEQPNPLSEGIDNFSVRKILDLINRDDQKVAQKVREALPEIEDTVELTTSALRNGNRVFYMGAGTSGRLGVLDASEMPPTFSVPPSWFTGIIAGGDEALRKSIEGAEDEADAAINDLSTHGVGTGDVIIGISTSGAAKYVQSALNYGNEIGSKTIYLTCTAKPFYPANVDIIISVDVGPEIITGSTRMKAGTATKMILNMISTATMIRLGKVYGNLMVDLMAVNEKLVDRGIRIIQDITNLDLENSRRILIAAKMSVKTALVMVKKDCNLDIAEKLLMDANGFIRDVID